MTPKKAIVIVVGIFVGTFLGNYLYKTVTANPASSSSILIGKNEMVKYGTPIGSEKSWQGKIVKIHELPQVPAGKSFRVAEVTYPLNGGSTTRFTFFSTQHGYKEGDEVTVHWVYFSSGTGGKSIPFIL